MPTARLSNICEVGLAANRIPQLPQSATEPVMPCTPSTKHSIALYRYSLFVDYRVQLESLPSVYGQLSHTPKSLKRLYCNYKHYLDSTTVGELPQRLWPYLLACAQIPQKRRWRELSGRGLERLRLQMTAKVRGAWGGSDGWADGGIESAGGLDHRLGGWAGVGNG